MKLRIGLYGVLIALFMPFAAFAFTVTYDCGDADVGSTAPAAATATSGENFSPVMIMNNSLCHKDGYILSGWLVSGTSDVKSGTFQWNYNEDKTLTAQWVRFDTANLYDPDAVPADDNQAKFKITTTNMSANATFKYWQGSEGLFYVDWGDGTQQTINYIGTISHTYATAGSHIIHFGGLASGYRALNRTNDNMYVMGSVGFGVHACAELDEESGNCTSRYTGTPTFVSGISGSLGAIYPSLNGSGSAFQPKFVSTFRGCTNLIGAIPSNLFAYVTGDPDGATDAESTNRNISMFQETFSGCTNLGRNAVGGTPTHRIPSNLFSSLNNAATAMGMFQSTFEGCSGLSGAIPSNLFDGVTGIPRAGLFHGIFYGCSGLTGTIPYDLFANISGDAGITKDRYTIQGDATYTLGATAGFARLFEGCSGLTGGIPGDLFENISGSAAYLFYRTFYGCTGLNDNISGDLFQNISGYAKSLFNQTFGYCENLTGSIPVNLFRGINGTAESMFNGTFDNCSRLTSVPAGLFASIPNGAVAQKKLFRLTFQGCCSISSIPADLFSHISGAAEELFYGTFTMARCASTSCPTCPASQLQTVPSTLFSSVSGTAKNMFANTFRGSPLITIPNGLFSSVTGAAQERMFYRVFEKNCSLSGTIPSDLFSGVTGTAKDLFRSAFNMADCGENVSQLDATYVSPALFAGITPLANGATDVFTDTFKSTPLLTECPCGSHSATTAYNLSSIDGRAVCADGLKTLSRDGLNEYYYTGVSGHTECMTGCSFATDLKTENGLSYSLLSEQPTAPSMRFKSGAEVCHVPLEIGSGSLNLKWENNLYHVANVDTD